MPAPPGAKLKCFLKDARSINSCMEQRILFSYFQHQTSVTYYLETWRKRDDLQQAQVAEGYYVRF